MTIREIVQDYLRGLQYDGLVNVWNKCGCGMADLPCECPEFAGVYACVPAYRWTCPESAEYDCSAVDDGAHCEMHGVGFGCYQPRTQP